MGQGSSQPERRSSEHTGTLNQRASLFRRSLSGVPHGDDGHQDGLLRGQSNEGTLERRRQRARPNSIGRLSQLMNSSDTETAVAEENNTQQRPRRSGHMLERTRSTFRDMLSRRPTTRTRTADTPASGLLQHRASYVRSGMNSDGNDYYPPRLPSIDISSSFDNEPFEPATEAEPLAPRSSQSTRRSNFRSLRPDRPFRHLASLRRRRSPPPAAIRAGAAEDQAAMLSRLLSIAAAATAATLMGHDHQALSEARSLTGATGVGDIGAGGEDGSFYGFLQALENGRIASALRGNEAEAGGSNNGGQQGPLNFFRMFRFGTTDRPDAPSSAPTPAADGEEGNADGRMVPIIIVGIRIVSPSGGANAGAGGEEHELPPFIDALGSFPSPLPAHALGTHGHDSIDSILRPPQNGTSFRHRRRASMGAFARTRLSDRMDDQRSDRRRERPWSMASTTSNPEPRVPPATPASSRPEASRVSSRNSTPSHSRPTSLVANSLRDFGGDSRRNSALQRISALSPLSSHTEETLSLHSTHSDTNFLNQDTETPRANLHRRSDTTPNIHYPRFASGHPRRNGVVEPDNLPRLSRTSTSNLTDVSSSDPSGRESPTGTRSWIIYVLGGSYPENHPILTTPSLFTENPTYEDMMLLSALLGPAKAPVATREDVESSGGLYRIEMDPDAAKTAAHVAVAVGGDDRVVLEQDHRCLVCLCDFELKEVARKLAKCNHLFHQECIDQWLTQGRNSCPLCRGQGVDEKTKPSEEDQVDGEESEAATTSATAGTSGSREAPLGEGLHA